MDDIYVMSDEMIMSKMGERLRSVRLKQNITQQSLSEEARVSLSSVKKMEKGGIRSFDSLLRVMRTLGELEVLLPLVEEEQLSPSEYYEWVHNAGSHQRKRAAGRLHKTDREDSEW